MVCQTDGCAQYSHKSGPLGYGNGEAHLKYLK